LLRWFDRHGRKDLPWQKAVTPYRIWLSEIMLQQTQVTTVIPYYRKFLQRFPNLKSLAAADIDEVLSHWSGLGYYARARNLHKAAQLIVAQHGGRFPKDIDTITALPGIGRSTAGAILAFSFGQRHPILDGNVKRVLARVIALDQWPGSRDGEAALWQWSERLTPRHRIADYTQAIMDLGATVCTRSKPACDRCPMTSLCRAHRDNRVAELPVRKPTADKPKRSAIFLMIRNPANEILLVRRPPAGIWGGLWCFPQVDQVDDAKCDSNIARWASKRLGLVVETGQPWPGFVHHFSHYSLAVTPLPARLVRTNGSVMEDGATVWYKPSSKRDRGLARPVEKLLNELRNTRWHEW
jgi:A/G-specific adenine glycosylase